jgi:hypothetical protein
MGRDLDRGQGLRRTREKIRFSSFCLFPLVLTEIQESTGHSIRSLPCGISSLRPRRACRCQAARRPDDPDLLWFACAECNWAEGPDHSGLLGGKLYPLFNPRKQRWKRQFRWDTTVLVGKTFSGKDTVQVLSINDGTTATSR